MGTAIFFGVIIIFVTLTAFAVRHFHVCDVDMSASLYENKRLDKLTDDAMRYYPGFPMIKAMQQYVWDLEERVETLRKSAQNTDVVYAIESDLRDCTILRTEIARLINLEIEFNSHFNVLHAAQA